MSDPLIADEHLVTREAREAYARRLGLSDTAYLETLAYSRQMGKGLTDSQIIDLLDLPWEKHPDGDRFANEDPE